MTEYTTERGITIDVVPIPLLLDKIRQAHPEPKPVTYTEHLAGGEIVQVAITPASAQAWQTKDPAGWAPHADAWAAWQALDDARTERLNDVLWRAVMLQAIKLEIPPDSEWVPEQESYGLVVPASPTEKRVLYIWTRVMGGTRDTLRIMGLASGIALTDEQVASAEASFRDTLQRPGAESPAAEAGALDALDAGGDGADGEGVGNAPLGAGPVCI